MLCGKPCDGGAVPQGENGVLQVEAMLLVLRPSKRADQAAFNPSMSYFSNDSVDYSDEQVDSQPGDSQPHPDAPPVPVQRRSRPAQPPSSKLPATSWSALSAMAGGSARSPRSDPASTGRGRSQQAGSQQATPAEQSRTPMPTPFSSRPPQVQRTFRPDGSDAPVGPLHGLRTTTAKFNAIPRVPSALQGSAQRVSVGDFLVTSLTAQSLDLPPQAARWRQQQRGDGAGRRKLVVWEVDELDEIEVGGQHMRVVSADLSCRQQTPSTQDVGLSCWNSIRTGDIWDTIHTADKGF